METLKINTLTKIYGSQKAVNNISFSIEKGEIVGFLGPNGAGKSTTMKIITGFISESSGTVEVFGEKMSIDSKDLKSKIGYLPEHNPLYLEMYVREYLHMVASFYPIKNTDEHIEKIIDKVGLRSESNKKIEQLSKGYRQRVGLAQAIFSDPELLILDEPTTGLDPNQLVEIRSLIKEIGSDKTVILSTHIMQEVEALCQRVIIINKGEIVIDSSKDALMHQYGSLEQAFRVLTN
jgi:ABC-2 type transport system ATP-binding protein